MSTQLILASGRTTKSVEVARPFAVKGCNSHGWGRSFRHAHVDHKSKKWYIRVFFWIIDVSVVNAWLLYKRHCEQLAIKRKLSLLVFRSPIAQALALVQAKAVKWRSVSSDKCGAVFSPEKITRPVTPKPVTDVRFDGVDHWPQYGETKNRCKYCTPGYTFPYCEKCKMHLCLLPSRNCFNAFHVK